MRIREYQKIISEINMPILNLDIRSYNNSSNNYGVENNLNLISLELRKLIGNEILPEIASKYLDEINSLKISNVFGFTKKTYLEDLCNQLIYGLNGFDDISKRLITSQSEDTICIKLPTTNSMSEMSEYLSTIEKTLSSVLIDDEINGKVEFKNFDNGSIWIKILVGTTSAVNVVGGIAWASVVVYKKMQEANLIKEQVRTLKIKNETLEDLSNGLKEESKLILEAEAKNIQDINFKNNEDFEKLERIKLSIKTFADLISKGAEFHPALNAPETVDNLFPKSQSLELITSKIKHLENKMNK